MHWVGMHVMGQKLQNTHMNTMFPIKLQKFYYLKLVLNEQILKIIFFVEWLNMLQEQL